MRRIFFISLAIAVLLGVSSSFAFAGGNINKSNLSADYFGSLTRHAATNAPDIIAYNPAGVMKLKNGFYTKLDVIYFLKDYTNNVPNTLGFSGTSGLFESDAPSVIPGFFTLYKQDKWACYFAVTVPGGGGDVEYAQGNARTAILGAGYAAAYGATSITNMSIEANSHDIGYTFGGAYEVNKMLSLAGGIRFIDGSQEFKGHVTYNTGTGPAVDLERTAQGVGYFLGANISPTEKLNVGLLFQSNTRLNFESSVAYDTSPGQGITTALGWSNGTKEREDLPGLIGIGVGYQLMPKLRAEVAYTHYLESDATLEGNRFQDIGDSWEIAFSLTYQINSQWRASMGYMHTDMRGLGTHQLLAEAPELDAQTYAIGAVYSPTPAWDISLNCAMTNYDEVTTDARAVAASRAPSGTVYDKEIRAIAIGVNYRWF